MSILWVPTTANETGERLFAIRSNEGLSCEAFGATLGHTERGYIRYERGQVPLSESVVKQLQILYEVDPMWLLSGDPRFPVYTSRLKNQQFRDRDCDQDACIDDESVAA